MAKRLADCRVAIVGLGLMGASLAMDLTAQPTLPRGARRGPPHGDGARSLLCRRGRSGDQRPGHGRAGRGHRDPGHARAHHRGPCSTRSGRRCGLARWSWTWAAPRRTSAPRWTGCPRHVQPIGGHPMTGKETAGFERPSRGSIESRTWVLAPLPRTRTKPSNWRRNWSTRSARVRMSCRRSAMTGWWRPSATCRFWSPARWSRPWRKSVRDDAAVWDLAAGGFRDTSRVAASDTRMFLDILMTNRPAVLAQVDAYLRSSARSCAT